jgi:iron complex transport system ATP-binding protein
MAVIGPNGAGKSTLLRALAGTLVPSAGRVTLDGVDLGRLSGAARAARVAYIAQRPSVAVPMDVRRVVELGRHGRAGGLGAIDRAVTALDLDGVVDRPIAELSAGQQQRVSLARALAQLDRGGERGGGDAPDHSGALDLSGTTLLADEPISAMDPAHALRTLELLRGLAARGAGVVVVLHELSLALRFCDHAALLAGDGTLAFAGPIGAAFDPERLRALYGIGFVREGPTISPVLERTQG